MLRWVCSYRCAAGGARFGYGAGMDVRISYGGGERQVSQVFDWGVGRFRTVSLAMVCVLLAVGLTSASDEAPQGGSAEVGGAEVLDGGLLTTGLVEKSSGPAETAPPAVTAVPRSLTASDGVKIYSDFYRSPRRPTEGVILLFHQAGSNAAEYAPIAPRLNALGFDALAIDQRAGGRMWGVNNRTAVALGRPADFNEAFLDLEAAVVWARREGYRQIVAWGSSYSAASLFRLSNAHPEVTGLLAFSPGEFLGSEFPVKVAAEKVTVPLYVTAGSGSEVFEARTIFEAARSEYKAFGEPVSGVHGSSTLREDRNPQGALANWIPVEQFLEGLK